MERDVLLEKAVKVSYLLNRLEELKEQLKSISELNCSIVIVDFNDTISSSLTLSDDTRKAIIRDIEHSIKISEDELKLLLK